jgi:N-acetylmuramoyl-L-alanine amidase
LRASPIRRALTLVALVPLLAAPAGAATQRAMLPGGELAVLVDKKDLFLEAPPRRGEGLTAFTRRLTGGIAAEREIAWLNRQPKRLLAGVRYRVAFAALSPEWKLATVRALFPKDAATAGGWVHVSTGEDLGRIASWFTGGGDAAETLRVANDLPGRATRTGQPIRIPNELLPPIFRWAAPTPLPTPVPRATPREEPTPTPARPAPTPAARVAASEPEVPAAPLLQPLPVASPTPLPIAIVAPVAPSGPDVLGVGPLDFAEDARGRYAVYRLRPGEALYSAVVVRFTGRIHAEDVNALAAEIAQRSGIADVTDIPIGFPVEVPLDLLLPDYLPATDPRRLEWEAERRSADRFKNEVQARGLENVTVILDSGHGGADVGASSGGVWESLYVYDVTLRIKRLLETETRARVHTTVRDGAAYVIVDRDVLPFSRGHQVLTRPPYAIADATIGVHLRWYLANSLLRRVTGPADQRVVFLSIHADSLHASIRGATAYIPSAALTGGTFGKSGSVFAQRQEVKERPKVSFTLRERQKSEGLSRELAGEIIAAFRAQELAVHPFQPVRDRIFRGRRAWVPAVLRYNAVPAKLLLEVGNLANPEDRRLLQTRAFRDRVARAVVAGLRSYFGGGEGGGR